ncbi:hypothetical protein C8A01DRAFT_19901 [Parachaetomium inaequale]|uniref:Uncharacterized protein n=1 Tax=Parachaetomium inaequale TaxID=2588326 RepID=A0AAN6P7D9_9PEZI|nr:hypothetical protein C8A01DRAFT_19901 [Parachaetomium inaequale]
MCKIRVVHFSVHDVRTQMATDPFSAIGGASDFTAYPIIRGCPCTHPIVRSLFPDGARGELVDQEMLRGLEPCIWHECCVSSYQAYLCRWYYDNREALDLDDEPEVEMQCPNKLMLHEFHHISMVLDDSEGWMPKWDKWETRKPFPAFPAGDLCYSEDIIDGTVDDPESLGLSHDREEVALVGEELWRSKRLLQTHTTFATEYVESLERDFNSEEGLRCFAQNPALFLRGIRLARGFIRLVQFLEDDTADSFRQMMQRIGFVLTVLNKMPAVGQSVTSADGSFTVSRERLDLGDLDAQAVIDACDGPLKQSRELRERFEAATSILQVPKKLRKRGIRNTRGISVPAIRKGKCRKV